MQVRTSRMSTEPLLRQGEVPRPEDAASPVRRLLPLKVEGLTQRAAGAQALPPRTPTALPAVGLEQPLSSAAAAVMPMASCSLGLVSLGLVSLGLVSRGLPTLLPSLGLPSRGLPTLGLWLALGLFRDQST